MPKANPGGWKTCSRGHKYRGEGPCQVCWPGRLKRATSAGDASSSATPKASGSDAVNAYIRRFPAGVRQRLQEMRKLICISASEATERISYQMPSFFLNGALVWFAAFERHIGFYPGASGVAAFENELAKYKHAKGSIQFPNDQPLPVGLIKRIVKFRVKENLKKKRKES